MRGSGRGALHHRPGRKRSIFVGSDGEDQEAAAERQRIANKGSPSHICIAAGEGEKDKFIYEEARPIASR